MKEDKDEKKWAGEKGWTPGTLARAIGSITGVLEVGLFTGVDGVEAAEAEERDEREGRGRRGRVGGEKPVACYFGMEDGSVEVRVRKGGLAGIKGTA